MMPKSLLLDSSRRGLFRTGATSAALTLSMALALLLAASCTTIQRDVQYGLPMGTMTDDLGSIELELVNLRLEPDGAGLAAARAKIAELGKAPNTDPLFRARLLALSAEAARLAGERGGAERRLAESKAAYPGDELALLVEALLQKDLEKKLGMLDAAIAKADVSDKLQAEKAATLLESGRYREALALFDEALPRLPHEYAALYAAHRDKAFALRDANGALKESSATYLSPRPITFIGMVIIAQQETTLLDWFTGGAPWAPGVLFERLKGAGWFADQASKAATEATRKDAALFVWQLLSRGKSAMLSKYSLRYAERGTSPVPDVPFGTPWFDAVIGLVEEEIMNLPDGKNFMPNEAVSGLDFFGVITAAAKYR